MQNAAAGRIELIARTFAETGVRDLFMHMLHLVTKYQSKPRIVRLSGKYVEMDPRQWKTQYDIRINVGLGTGTRDQQLAMLAMVLQKQEQLLGSGAIGQALVGVSQYRSALGRFIEAAGFVDSAEFFRELPPEAEQQMAAQAQQPQADPATQALMAQTQAQVQASQAKAQADIQVQQMKAQADIQLAREKAAAEIQLAREKAEASLQLKIAEFQAEAQMKAAKVGAEITGNVEIPGEQRL
jgi:hypothetical protein